MAQLEKIQKVAGRAVPIPGDDVDTDRIIPARFMKCVTFDGLGEYAFYDVRFDGAGNLTGHPLNDPRFQDAAIMVAGRNFGCGSSREHAPQSLFRYGVRGIIAQSFAEIFFGNCTTLGIPCAAVSEADCAALKAVIEAEPTTEVEIDIAAKVVRAAGKEYPCDIPASAREGLLNGEWDPIALLLGDTDAIDATAAKLNYA